MVWIVRRSLSRASTWPRETPPRYRWAAPRGAALFVATVTQSRPRRRQFGKRNLDPPAARGVPPGCTIRRVVDQHHTCHPLAADPAPQHAQHAPQSGTGALLCQHSERQAGQAVAAFDAQPAAAQIGQREIEQEARRIARADTVERGERLGNAQARRLAGRCHSRRLPDCGPSLADPRQPCARPDALGGRSVRAGAAAEA